MPPLTGIHFKYNNIIDLSCIISQSLVTDNVGFNRIKYIYTACDTGRLNMKWNRNLCLVWGWESCHDKTAISEFTKVNELVIGIILLSTFTFRNGTILTVSQRVAIEIWRRRVVWYSANNTPGNRDIAHTYPQLTMPTRISFENSFRKSSAALTAFITLTSGGAYHIAMYLASQEETVHLFEFEQASFEMTSIETWSNWLLCNCWFFPYVSPQPITITSVPVAGTLESKFNRTGGAVVCPASCIIILSCLKVDDLTKEGWRYSFDLKYLLDL